MRYFFVIVLIYSVIKIFILKDCKEKLLIIIFSVLAVAFSLLTNYSFSLGALV